MNLTEPVDLSVIIVNWNTAGLTRQCLKSIPRAAQRVSLQITVVDNASTDGSVDLLRREFADVELIVNSRNEGFARANNAAMKQARGRYMLLLNSDTIVRVGAFDSAVEFLDAHDEFGALTPRILNADGSIQHPRYVRDPSLVTEAIAGFGLRPLTPTYGVRPAGATVRGVCHATGACLFLRTLAVQAVGLLDEHLFFSMEDVDFCIRIRKAGWQIVYLPDATIVHLGGASRRKFSDDGRGAMLENKYRFYRKYHSNTYVAGVFAVIMLGAMTRAALTAVLSLLDPPRKRRWMGHVRESLQILRATLSRQRGL